MTNQIVKDALKAYKASDSDTAHTGYMKFNRNKHDEYPTAIQELNNARGD